MAKCPSCKVKLPFFNVLFLSGLNTTRCKKCRTELELCQSIMIPLIGTLGLISVSILYTYIDSGLANKWLVVFIVWVIVAAVFYVSVAKLKPIEKDKQ